MNAPFALEIVKPWVPPQPRWYQTECCQSFYDFFASLASGEEGNPIAALPTGTGKSLVIAMFITRALKEYPQTRILALTHVKELIEQNANKLLDFWPNAPLGIYSAGLRQRDIGNPVLFGGVQSVVRCKPLLELYWDIVLIDECHLLSPKEGTSYIKIINALRAVNPRLRVIGLSATPFRLGQGMLTEEVEKDDKKIKLFTHVCYDMTDMEGWKRLIAEGYLCPPITPSRLNREDAASELVEILPENTKIDVVNGDFNQAQLEAAVDKDPVTRAALQQAVQLGKDRYCWLVFAAGIHHAERVWRMLNDEFGIPTCVIHSKRTVAQNTEALAAWKRGEARCAVNMNSLTTGVDHQPVDFIIMLRPSMSPGLWVQMLGRGTRPYDFTKNDELAGFFPFKKQNCLVADFARNTKRLGPINDPRIPKKKTKGGGDMPVKICDACGEYNHTRARFCEFCHYEFPSQVDIARTASTEDIMKSEMPIVEYFDVTYVIYNLHEKKDRKTGILLSPPMVRVDYMCGMQRFSEYLCFEHKGFPQHRAREWWRQRSPLIVPLTTAEALRGIASLRKPARIRVWVNKDPAEVLNCEF